jgi:hypothetical protein
MSFLQVMRDIDRPDRKDRELRRKDRKQRKMEAGGGEDADSFQDTLVGSPSDHAKASAATAGSTNESEATAAAADGTTKDSMTMLAETSTTAEKAAVEEAMAATEAALDNALQHSVTTTATV